MLNVPSLGTGGMSDTAKIQEGWKSLRKGKHK